ncbi:MAG: hypothetical protein RQ745_08510 [Longimicrobiales bacterium]|nr:hypothetical protein [Longimicrobiales bacterium]
MNDTAAPTAASPSSGTPRHLWIVGGLALLWNGFGAFDYLMTQTGNEAYLAQFSPEQLEFFTTFPYWVVSFWALAVWGAVLGSVLLLLRKRLAAPVFLVSFVSMVITSAHNFLLVNGAELMGAAGVVFSGVIFLVALGLWLYARSMARVGVLA